MGSMKSLRVVEKVSVDTEMKNPARPEARMRQRETEAGAALKKHRLQRRLPEQQQC